MIRKDKSSQSPHHQIQNSSNNNSNEIVGEFWIDDIRPTWNKNTNKNYVIRTFSNQPVTPFFKRNKDLGRELFFFACLLIIGSIIIAYNSSLIHRREFIASMFFASGFIPAVQLVIFDFLPKKFLGIQIGDLFSISLSGIFLAIAIVVYPTPEEQEDAWHIVMGKTLFEAGLIYFVTRVLFFVPNPNDEVKKLKQEISELKSSTAIGLADGYFWNLIKEIAIDIRDAPNQNLELSYPPEKRGDPERCVLKLVHRILIIVPRELDWTKEDPIADFVRLNKKQGYFQDCKIKKSVKRDNSTRVKWVTDVIENPYEEPQTSISSTLKDGLIVDIPTTITALLMKLRHQCDDNKDGKGKHIDVEKFQAEVSSFAYRIAWQLKKQSLERYVAVVEVDNMSNLIEKIKMVNDELSMNYMNV